MKATRMGLHSGKPESPPARVTVMAVGIVTIWTTDEEGGTITLVVGAGAVDDELVGGAPEIEGGRERKAG